MRVLVVAPEWPPNTIGGGGVVFERIARHLASRGHYVTAAVGNYRNGNLFSRAQRRLSDGVDVVELPLFPTPSLVSWLATALPPVPAAFYELRQVLDHGWDVAHLHGVGFPMVDYAASVLKRLGVPYVFTIHGVPVSPLRRGAITAEFMRWYLANVTSRTIRAASRVTAVSAAMLHNGVLAIPNGDVIYNGISVDDETREARRAHIRIHSPLRLMSMSRLSKNKGLDIAVGAVHSLMSRGIPVVYDLFGTDGGDYAALRKLVEQYGLSAVVRFCGQFEPTSRADILQRYDACLVPSRVEAFGLVALEAQLAGLPVIAAAREGLREVLDAQSAVLLDSEDPVLWADAILSITDTDKREQIIAAGLTNAARFTWDAILPKYESELIAAAEAKGGSNDGP